MKTTKKVEMEKVIEIQEELIKVIMEKVIEFQKEMIEEMKKKIGGTE